MTGIELLQKYPRAASVIKNWFIWRMVDALQDESIDDEFKQLMRDQGIENDNIAPIIDANPRVLFDVFDEHKIFICIAVWTKTPKHFENVEFSFSINATNKNNSNFVTRKEAELFAIEEAFEILENQLTPKEETNENK
jgi:hypothetical protein